LLRNRGFAARVGLVCLVGAPQRPPPQAESPLIREARLRGWLVLLHVTIQPSTNLGRAALARRNEGVAVYAEEKLAARSECLLIFEPGIDFAET
jgi:hypothetical protein